MTHVKKRFITIGLIAVLALGLVAGPAYAYFTAVTNASGEQEITLGYSTEVEEQRDGLNKDITIVNNGKADAMVRAWLFGVQGNENLSIEVIPGDGWTLSENQGDQRLYTYSGVLKPGDKTSSLKVKVTSNPRQFDDQIMDNLSDFDIVVVGQTSPAAYDDKGNPYPYNWS